MNYVKEDYEETTDISWSKRGSDNTRKNSVIMRKAVEQICPEGLGSLYPQSFSLYVSKRPEQLGLISQSHSWFCCAQVWTEDLPRSLPIWMILWYYATIFKYQISASNALKIPSNVYSCLPITIFCNHKIYLKYLVLIHFYIQYKDSPMYEIQFILFCFKKTRCYCTIWEEL